MFIKPQTIIPEAFPITKIESKPHVGGRFDNVSSGYTPHTRPVRKTARDILRRALAVKIKR